MILHSRVSHSTARSSPRVRRTMSLLLAALTCLLAAPAKAQPPVVAEPVHAFNVEDGSRPQSGLLKGADGRLYGTTIYGGPNSLGTVFALDPVTGTLTTIYAFSGADGSSPAARLVQGRDGRLYGTTTEGGPIDYGTVFALTTDGVLTTLHTFGGDDGGAPRAGLLETGDGTLYGTATFGGANGDGVIFKVPPGGALSVVASFSYSETGSYPRGDLVLGRDGRIFGTTPYGGPKGGGTVFAVTTAGTLTTLHAFDINDGSASHAGLIQAPGGMLYGTTREGGTHYLGTVFSIDESGVLTTLHNFSGGDGSHPEAPLLRTPDGQLFGTTTTGGDAGYGTVFTIDQSGTLTTLHSFHYAEGRTPRGGLALGGDGLYYGTAESGGQSGEGAVFRLKAVAAPRPPTLVWPTPAAIAAGTPLGAVQLNATASAPGTFAYTPAAGTVLAAGANQVLSVAFTPADPAEYTSAVARVTIDVVTPPPASGVPALATLGGEAAGGGRAPQAGLVEGRDGRLYGTMMYGGASDVGTLFAVDPATGARTTLFAFSGANGSEPGGRLMQGRDGRLYGTTRYGGADGFGTVFAFDVAAGTLTTLRAFDYTHGSNPQAGLIEASDGTLYGTTMNGGPSGLGTIFSVDAAGVLTTIWAFDQRFYSTHGGHPRGDLGQGRDGRIYGTTMNGGPKDAGTVFALNAAGNLITLHGFAASDGKSSYAALIQGPDGAFYGTTRFGGAHNMGTVFAMNEAGVLTTLHHFSGGDGANPEAPLVRALDGDLYGTTTTGGAGGFGTVFKLNGAGALTTLHAFRFLDGRTPRGGLIQGSNGTFYGTAEAGGPDNAGVVFRLTRTDAPQTPRVVWPDPAPIPQGTPLGAAQLNATSNVPGTFAYAPASGTVLGAGANQALSVTFHPADAAAYLSVTAYVTIDVFTPPPNPGVTEFSVTLAPGAADGKTPVTGLIEGRNGILYGTTMYGGPSNVGTVFAVDPATGTRTTLAVFNRGNGADPSGRLMQGRDGRLYGTTTSGGAGGFGTVFALEIGGALTTLHAFSGPDGRSPETGLIEASDGRLYGTTSSGGPLGGGTIFTLDPAGTLTTMFPFESYTGSLNSWGSSPYGELMQGRDGRIYGTTPIAGPNGFGTVFALDAEGSLTTVYAFGGGGQKPFAGLIQAPDGTFYGTTREGGAHSLGTVFRLTEAGALTTLHHFSAGEGSLPEAPLVLARDGRLYGTTSSGGDAGNGTIFALDDSGAFTKIYDFSGSDGRNPSAGLLETTGGALYGTTQYGGTSNAGVVFRTKAIPVITWPSPAGIVYGTALGAVQLNAAANVAGAFVYTPAAGTILNAGAGQSLLVTFTPSDRANYAIAMKTVSLDVAKATPALTWANPAGIVYGTALGAAQLNATASVPGAFEYTPPSGTLLNAGAGQTLSATFTPADTANYTGAAAGVLIDVAKATPVLTWANPAGIVYGTALGAAQLNATANVAGTMAYTPPSGTLLNAGAGQPLSAAFTPADAANYHAASGAVTIDVAKATPIITWANPSPIVVGAALSATQLNATADAAGTFAYTPPAGTVLGLGAGQTLSAVFTPADGANYNTAAATVRIDVVLPSPPVITGVTPGSGATGSGVTLTGTGFAGATAAAFRGVPAVYTVVSDTRITTTVPAAATTGPVRVTGPGGTGTSPADFVVTNQRASRSLPGCYVASYAVTVSIDVGPASGVLQHAVEDTPPAGWAVGAISNGGAWDAGTGQVTWGPFFDATARVLTYAVTPPAGTSDTVTFAGVVRFDGVAVGLGGTATLSRCEQHPADGNSDFRMVIGEVTGYGAAWKKGDTWAVPPLPIPIGYVTRAGYLWRSGETYHREVGDCPLCWMPGTLAPGSPEPNDLFAADELTASRRGPSSAASGAPLASRLPPAGSEHSPLRIGTAVREAPATCVPTVPLTVTLTVTPDEDAQAWAVEETVPAGWRVTLVSADGHWDEKAGVVRWGPFFDELAQTLRYTLTPPAEAFGPQELRGTASFDGVDVVVTGAHTLQRAPITRSGEPAK